MVRITCHIPITPICNPSGRSAKVIPNRGSPTILLRRPLNLKRRTRKPVQKIRWQRHSVKPSPKVNLSWPLWVVGRRIYASGVEGHLGEGLFNGGPGEEGGR
jgi:hypothetical protein